MKPIFLVLSMLLSFPVFSQEIPTFHDQAGFHPQHTLYLNAHTPDSEREKWVNRITLGGYSVAALYLGTSWYANEELGHFRFFDDANEWKQMDKVGHAFGGYHASRWMIDLYKWSGLPKEQAIWRGSLFGFAAMSSIEVLDGFAKKWGASWTDVGANLIGSGLAAGNELLWHEQRLQLKVSYIQSPFVGQETYEDLFGNSYAQWFLKDYNGQTLWLSVRVHSFLPEGSFKRHYPRWLNLAVGYGAEGLIGGYGEEEWEVIRQREYRQFYLALDIDLTNIQTNSGFLNTLFSIIGMVRIPGPALQLDKSGVRFQPFR
ncbi:MAG: DUF2279 domain-containing protein [Bacteroidota bacterium]